jgi:hypothetical protein
MKKFISLLALIAAVALSGCTRIATGEAGVRINMNNLTEPVALKEGTWNQTLFGHVLTFPVREVGLAITKRTPLTQENVPLGEFDAVLTYNIHPDMVPELWSQRSRSFHAYNPETGEYHLMESYLTTMTDNAILKTVRQYKQLAVNDNRKQIEQQVLASLREELKNEHLDNVVTVNNLQVKNMVPNGGILASAQQIIQTQNALTVKQNEVAIAQQEAQRMQALASQGQQSINYMAAQAMLNISEGIKAGKVNSIVVPADFRGLLNVGIGK